MKKFLLAFIALLCFSQSNAYTESLKMYLENLFGALDKTQVPTGYLKEYGAEFMPLHWFNAIPYKCHSP